MRMQERSACVVPPKAPKYDSQTYFFPLGGMGSPSAYTPHLRISMVDPEVTVCGVKIIEIKPVLRGIPGKV
jgi:hypothetical protein